MKIHICMNLIAPGFMQKTQIWFSNVLAKTLIEESEDKDAGAKTGI